MKKFRITYNAPVVLTFALIAVVVHLLGESFKDYFVMRPSLESFGDYVALVSHIAGHADWEHLLGNFTMILLLGPMLEERYGSPSLLGMIVATAVVTSLLNLVIFKTHVLGASGVVFMFILLASTANIKKREIPLSFIAVAILYMGGEVVGALREDQISQMAHLIGGLVGAGFGFLAANLPDTTKSAAKIGD